MFRHNWRSPAFWRWWWRYSASAGIKGALVLLLVAALLVGGYFAAGGLTRASAAGTSSSYVLKTTVRKVVTVREHGKLIVKRVPVVVHRDVIRSQTQTQTAYQTVVNDRTVVQRQIVTTPGQVRTVVHETTRFVPVERVVTRTVTQPVTVTQTVVSTVTVTSPSP